VIQSYLSQLRHELRARGIRGQLCARILTECAHHLQSGDATAEQFGAPRELANDFAAELGADASRRAAIRAFAALGVAGAVYASAFVSLAFAHPPSEMFDSALGALAFAIVIFAPQVAFVAGALALVRALRRGERVLPTRELVVLNRRTGVALVFGLATMGGLALYAHEFGTVLARWWPTFTYASTAAASSLLVAALVSMARAVRLRPLIAGQAGDVFDDLGVDRLRTEPWRFARRVALGVGLAVWLAGIAQADPLDGLLRGVFEGLACLAGFAVLGRYLGLRR
jgi:hypothetical protein